VLEGEYLLAGGV